MGSRSSNRVGYPRVPNAPFREAFENSGLTLGEVCRRLETIDDGSLWMRTIHRRGRQEVHPNVPRLGRLLGYYKNNKGLKQEYVWIENASKLCMAMDIDPHEVGL